MGFFLVAENYKINTLKNNHIENNLLGNKSPISMWLQTKGKALQRKKKPDYC
jgi:hypothetical protein